jgi:hypothetical protein
MVLKCRHAGCPIVQCFGGSPFGSASHFEAFVCNDNDQ